MEHTLIHKTKNYAIFSSFASNRNKRPRPDLLDSIAKRGLINPIIVDSKLRIIDGQHRLEACKALDVPVEYMIRNFDEKTIVEVNSHQMKWTPYDFLDSHIKQGKQSYVIVKQLIDEYDLNLQQFYIVLRSSGSRMMKRERGAFELGNFTLEDHDIKLFRATMSSLLDIFQTSGGVNEKKFRHGSLFAVLVSLVNHPLYSADWFLNKLNNIVDHRIKSAGTMDDMRLMIEGIYNQHIRKGRIYFRKSAKRS